MSLADDLDDRTCHICARERVLSEDLRAALPVERWPAMIKAKSPAVIEEAITNFIKIGALKRHPIPVPINCSIPGFRCTSHTFTDRYEYEDAHGTTNQLRISHEGDGWCFPHITIEVDIFLPQAFKAFAEYLDGEHEVVCQSVGPERDCGYPVDFDIHPLLDDGCSTEYSDFQLSVFEALRTRQWAYLDPWERQVRDFQDHREVHFLKWEGCVTLKGRGGLW